MLTKVLLAIFVLEMLAIVARLLYVFVQDRREIARVRRELNRYAVTDPSEVRAQEAGSPPGSP